MNFLQKFSFFKQQLHAEKFIKVESNLCTDEEFKYLGTETVQKAFELLESSKWKVEKVTASNDTIYTSTRTIGRVYKLTGKVHYSPKKLLRELFYNIENFPNWNPTLLESKIIRKIDSCTDIAYSVSASGGGGLVKSRDFVNLRCWKLIRNSQIVENYNINSSTTRMSEKTHSSDDGDNENSEEDENNPSNNKNDKKKGFKVVNEKSLKKSASDNVINETTNGKIKPNNKLSKSLGTKETVASEDDDDESFSDAQVDIQPQNEDEAVDSLENCMFVSAAMSIDYALYPPTSKYIRGDNLISCWAMRHVQNEPDNCIFEWLMCIDLKGSLPKYVLNTAFTSLMTDYMVHLRSRIQKLNDESSNNQCA